MGFFDRLFSFRRATEARYDKENGMTVVCGMGDTCVDMDFNMCSDLTKNKMLKYVAPLSFVLSRIGSMASDGVPYVVDENNNELYDEESEQVRKVLANPNAMQDFSQFTKCVEIYVKLYGFCPILIVRATEKSPIDHLVPIPPYIFHMEGRFDFSSNKFNGRAYFEDSGRAIELKYGEYYIIHDGICEEYGGELRFFSPVSSLSEQVRNYIGQIKARGNLIINGGGKGIIHGNDTSEFGNLELTPKEKDELNMGFKEKFGLVGQKYQIIVTRAKVGWIPLSFDVNQLALHDEDMACLKDISNAIGINPNLFISNSTFQNQEAVKKSAYQDVIIPDANRIARALTNILCSDGKRIKIDYSDVPCLQVDLSAKAMALKNMAFGISELLKNGLLTNEEARIEISKHLDINPSENKENGTE